MSRIFGRTVGELLASQAAAGLLLYAASARMQPINQYYEHVLIYRTTTVETNGLALQSCPGAAAVVACVEHPPCGKVA